MTDWLARMAPLAARDVPEMLALQSRMLADLPCERWYFPNVEAEFAADCAAGFATGIRAEGRLIALGVACLGSLHPGGSYAAVVGDDPAHTFDFRDVMVDPAWRRQGIHSAYLALYRARAEAAGCTAVYATVDPDNAPSWRSFEKAGFRRVLVRPAYDGRVRAYYRLALDGSSTLHTDAVDYSPHA